MYSIAVRFALAGTLIGQLASAQPPTTVSLTTPEATSPEEFSRIVSVRETVDGRLLVSDRRENRLALLDFARGVSTSIGRTGSGPAEFRSAGVLVPGQGDTIFLADPAAGRWLVVVDGTPRGVIPPDDRQVRFAPVPVGIDARYVYSYRYPPGGLGRPRDSTALARLHRATGRVDTLAFLEPQTVRATGTRQTSEKTEVRSLSISPWTAGDQALLFPDGWIAIARVSPYRVDWLTAGGELRRGTALPNGAIPFSEAEKLAFMARNARATGRPQASPTTREDWPDEVPPFTSATALLGEPSPALLATPDGYLAVRRTPTAAQSGPAYDIIDRLGRLVIRLALQDGEHLVGFGARHAYAVATDADGIQRVRRYAWPKRP